MTVRLASWTLLVVLAGAPLTSLPAREGCCEMAGRGMQCCLTGDTSASCQIRSCGPGSPSYYPTLGARADVAPAGVRLEEPEPAGAGLPTATARPSLEPPSPSVPPPRARA